MEKAAHLPPLWSVNWVWAPPVLHSSRDPASGLGQWATQVVSWDGLDEHPWTSTVTQLPFLAGFFFLLAAPVTFRSSQAKD